MTVVLRGLAAAPGIGIGVLALYHPGQIVPDLSRHPAGHPDQEWQRFLEAHALVAADLERLGQSDNSLIAEIFAAHQVILQDRTLLDSIRTVIYDQKTSAVAATQQVIGELAEMFHSFEDEYFAGRAQDILDIGERLLTHLGADLSRAALSRLPPQTILAADDLTPSDLAQLPAGHVLGIALAYSTPTAHSAILARSMGIPMVCALGQALFRLTPGQNAIVDGNSGRLLAAVSEEEMTQYAAERQHYLEEGAVALSHAQAPAVTVDGVTVPVLVNANSPQEVAQSRAVGADGVGLLRTEYLFRGRATPPTFAEQQATYAAFMAQVDHQLTVRALDAGGDKPVPFIAHHREDNPFLGLRGIRLLIEQPELLRTQYRALQAAACDAPPHLDVRFMLPMISTAEEIVAVQAILDEEDPCLLQGKELPRLKLGIMIEVPSAALIAHRLAPYVDFFSIGTNDLAQYVLASDRTNSTVARLADPLHPAVLRLIKLTCDAGQAFGKPVSLCGEIAGDPAAVPLLLGLGVTELSVPLPAAPLVKETVRHVDLSSCRALAEAALECDCAAAVRELLAQP
ncbi:MAG TPA: phosphoenolpyruvate--protein phosphotransferase [Caldilineaceae bacterium]|nr:phosphoenolpyruvate--protein phosphotransferase [Caldilineaceae bacterium]